MDKVQKFLYPRSKNHNFVSDPEWFFKFADCTSGRGIPLKLLNNIGNQLRDDMCVLFLGNRGNYASVLFLASLIKYKKINAEIILLDDFIPSWQFQDSSIFDLFLERIKKYGLEEIIIPFRQSQIRGLKFLSVFFENFNYILLENCNDIDEMRTSLMLLQPLIEKSRLIGWNYTNDAIRKEVFSFFNCVNKKKLAIDDDMWVIE